MNEELDTPSISSATRLAADMAAILRGCVHATIFPLVCGKSEYATNWGILVDGWMMVTIYECATEGWKETRGAH